MVSVLIYLLFGQKMLKLSFFPPLCSICSCLESGCRGRYDLQLHVYSLNTTATVSSLSTTCFFVSKCKMLVVKKTCLLMGHDDDL